MGRPRKQPRRIVTFNLNLPLAEAIDDLPVKNRSEWANKVLKTVLEDREMTTKEALEDRDFEVAEQAIADLASNKRRLAAMLLEAITQQGEFENLHFEDAESLRSLLKMAVTGE